MRRWNSGEDNKSGETYDLGHNDSMDRGNKSIEETMKRFDSGKSRYLESDKDDGR